jgi:DNA modification methylase
MPAAEGGASATGRPVVAPDAWASAFATYAVADDRRPLYLAGDTLAVLKALPAGSIDFAMTSPPYWGKRVYAEEGIGLEADHREYVTAMLAVTAELLRVLKPTGSLWLNVGDSYLGKRLLMLPWRLAIAMSDEQGWVLRNDVVWHKVKGGPDNAKDKLRNVHEPVFHFVKQAKGYYYDADAIRKPPGQSRVVNGSVVSATGVTGVRYKRQIQLSTVLSDPEKAAAYRALDEVLASVAAGELSDFRMVIRGQQRTTHSDSERVSGRAKELRDRGFYLLKYHPGGSKPGDVWDIIPEDTQSRGRHFAPYPEDLCRIPLLATCPPDGIALDPFCGTGTTNAVAARLGRKSVGIDLSPEYLAEAIRRTTPTRETT